MTKSHQYVVFTIDRNRFALHLSAVKRVVRMVQLTPVPEAPRLIAGMVNVQGELLPVVNMRRRFQMVERAVSINDQLIIASAQGRGLVLIVDAVIGVIEESDETVTDNVLLTTKSAERMMKTEDGIVILYDLENLDLDWPACTELVQ